MEPRRRRSPRLAKSEGQGDPQHPPCPELQQQQEQQQHSPISDPQHPLRPELQHQQQRQQQYSPISDYVHDVAHKASLKVPTRHRGTKSRDTQATINTTLQTFNNLPSHLQDNEYIRSGYRGLLPVKDALRSIVRVHTETGNIWTHLLGFMLFIWLTLLVVTTPPAPLAFSKHQIELLWHTVREDLHGLKLPGFAHHFHSPHLPAPTPHYQHPPSMGTFTPGLEAAQSPPGGPSRPDVQPAANFAPPSVDRITLEAHSSGSRRGSSAFGCSDTSSGTCGAGEGGSEGMGLVGLQHPSPTTTPTDAITPIANLHRMREALVSGVQAGLASAHSMQDTMHNHMHFLASHLEDALAGVFSYPTPRWPVYVFCAGAMICLLFSSVCHLLGCCQKHITQRVWRLDYTGIAVLIVTSFYPPVYYGFMCTPIWRAFYLTIVTIMGTGTIAVALLDEFQKPEWRSFRASMFAGLGLFGAVPILHGCLMNLNVWHVRVATVGDLLMGMTYLAGAAIYAQRIPERWYPGRFDLVLSSHQIFHVAVVIAAYIHWRVVLVLLEWRDASGGCAAPITSGPLHSVLEDMRMLGHELLHIDQVWSQLCSHAAGHLGLAGATQDAP